MLKKKVRVYYVYLAAVVEKCHEIVLKFSKKLVLKFYFVLLGPLNLPLSETTARHCWLLIINLYVS